MSNETIYSAMDDIDIDSHESPFYGIIYSQELNRWMANAPKLDIKMYTLSCKSFNFRRAKLIICQLVYFKLLEKNEWNLDRNKIINIFKSLNNKYIADPNNRIEWFNSINQFDKLKEGHYLKLVNPNK